MTRHGGLAYDIAHSLFGDSFSNFRKGIMPDSHIKTTSPSILSVQNNTPYLILIGVMVLLSVIATMGIMMIRPKEDNTVLLTLIYGNVGTVTAALLALLKSQQTHLAVNSFSDKFQQSVLDLAAAQVALANREGLIQGVADEQARLSIIPAPLSVKHPQPQTTVPPVAPPAVQQKKDK